MRWSDDGIILAVRPMGERGRVAVLFTRAHGKHAGALRGGRSKAQAGILMPGNHVAAHWQSRLSEQLGQYRLELHTAHAAIAFDDPLRLAILASACALSEAALPDRQPAPVLFEDLCELLAEDMPEALPTLYCLWEEELLRQIGYGQPRFGHNGGMLDAGACHQRLAISGHALQTHVLGGRPLPASRNQLLDRIANADRFAA